MITRGMYEVLLVFADGVERTAADLDVSYTNMEKLRYLRLLQATNPRERARRIFKITVEGMMSVFVWLKAEGRSDEAEVVRLRMREMRNGEGYT